MSKFNFIKKTAFILHLRALTAGFRKCYLEPQITWPIGCEERACKC